MAVLKGFEGYDPKAKKGAMWSTAWRYRALFFAVLLLQVYLVYLLVDGNFNEGRTEAVASSGGRAGPPRSATRKISPGDSAPHTHAPSNVTNPGKPSMQTEEEVIGDGSDGKFWLEVLSWEAPKAFLLHNFLSASECEHIVGLASPKVIRSQVVDAQSSYKAGMKSRTDEIRTSSGMFVRDGEDPVVDAYKERIAEQIMLPPENFEALQVLRYTLGQKYETHPDYFPDQMLDSSGNRICTCLAYLNTPEEGGETVFPRKKAASTQTEENGWSECGREGLGVKAHRGDVLCFWDMDIDGTPDPYSQHHACPVLKGRSCPCNLPYSVPHDLQTR